MSQTLWQNALISGMRRGALCVLVYATVCSPARGQTLEVQPATITSSSSAFTAKIRLHLKNTGKVTLRRIAADKFSVDGIDAQIQAARLSTARPSQEIEWPVTVTVPAGSHLPGAVVFVAQYGPIKRRRYVYATLTVQNDASAKPLEASMDGLADPVSEQRPGLAYIQVTNNLNVPARITIKYSTPKELLSLSDDRFDLEAHSSVARELELKTDRRVQPGAHALAIDIAAQWMKNGVMDQRHITLTKPVTVGVFFESELLKALSVPSLLLLPGCLVIFTMQAMLTFGVLHLKDDSRLPSLTITSPAFWIASITLSALFLFVYWLIMNINLVLSYGAMDLIYLWVSSILVGIAAYVTIALLTSKYRKDHVPNNRDGPLLTLKKMANNGLSLKVPKVKYKLNDTEFTGLLIEQLDEKPTLWIAPKIKAAFKGHNAPELESAFGELVNRGGAAAEMVTFLTGNEDEIDLEFERGLAMSKPYHVKVEAITGYLADGPVIG